MTQITDNASKTQHGSRVSPSRRRLNARKASGTCIKHQLYPGAMSSLQLYEYVGVNMYCVCVIQSGLPVCVIYLFCDISLSRGPRLVSE